MPQQHNQQQLIRRLPQDRNNNSGHNGDYECNIAIAGGLAVGAAVLLAAGYDAYKKYKEDEKEEAAAEQWAINNLFKEALFRAAQSSQFDPLGTAYTLFWNVLTFGNYSPDRTRWVPHSGKFSGALHGAQPIAADSEGYGTKIYVIRAFHKGGEHLGKIGAGWNTGYIIYDGCKQTVSNYQVLCYA